MAEPLLMRLLASSLSVSKRAAGIITDIMKAGDLGIVVKGKMDFQTEADRCAQKCILASLHKAYPKVNIFGEEELDPAEQIKPEWVDTGMSEEVLKFADQMPEEYKNVKDEEITVWVDPVDGTAEYTQGLLDHVTVLIGIAVGGKSVGGVIYQPYYNYQNPEAVMGRGIWGLIGVGAYGFKADALPEGERIVTTTRSHSNRAVVEAVEACDPTEVLRVGGAGHKVLLLIEGKAHAYVFASPGCKKWDTCAPQAVLHAAGGKLTDMHGNEILYGPTVQKRNTGGVLATNRADDHQWYKDQIPESVKEALPV